MGLEGKRPDVVEVQVSRPTGVDQQKVEPPPERRTAERTRPSDAIPLRSTSGEQHHQGYDGDGRLLREQRQDVHAEAARYNPLPFEASHRSQKCTHKKRKQEVYGFVDRCVPDHGLLVPFVDGEETRRGYG